MHILGVISIESGFIFCGNFKGDQELIQQEKSLRLDRQKEIRMIISVELWLRIMILCHNVVYNVKIIFHAE